MEVGQVFINQYFAGGVETPFGGYKMSGIGKEKGFEAEMDPEFMDDLEEIIRNRKPRDTSAWD